jgi:secreted PhoX family phosphatase
VLCCTATGFVSGLTILSTDDPQAGLIIRVIGGPPRCSGAAGPLFEPDALVVGAVARLCCFQVAGETGAVGLGEDRL